MSRTTIEEIARELKLAKDLAHKTNRIQYVCFFDGLVLYTTDQYRRDYFAKCWPGGRTELKGPIGDQVRKYQEGGE